MKARGLSASLASRLSKREEQGISSSRMKSRLNTSRGISIQSRIGTGQSRKGVRIPLSTRNKDSVHNRLNSGAGSRPTQPFRAHQPSIKLLRKEILSLSSAVNLPRRTRIQSRTGRLGRESDSVPFRINNGAIVKGLRSDQLMLQKYQEQSRSSSHRLINKPVTKPTKSWQSPEKSEFLFKKPGSVSMDFNTGLRVSFSNETALKKKSSSVRKPTTSQSEESDMSEEESPMLQELLRIGTERSKVPKLHKQMLDPLVQKEIAALQGHEEGPSNNGAGPGVKNFKMLPNRTKKSLSIRFTLGKNS